MLGNEGVPSAFPGDEARGVLRRSALLFVVTLLSVLSSFAWDVAIAIRFGISERSDAFYLAYTLPSIITTLVYLACYAVLMPAVAKRLGRGDARGAWEHFSTVMNVIILVILALGLAGAVGSYALMEVMAPGFAGQTLDRAAEMSAIMLATMSLGAAFQVGRVGLYAANRPLAPTAIVVVGNVVVLAFVVMAGEQWGVRSAAIGVAVSSAFQLALVLPLLLIQPGFRYRWSLRCDSEVKDSLRGIGGALAGMSARNLVLVVEKGLASTLPAGSITALNYGLRLGTVARTVFFNSVLTVLVPSLSVHLDRKDVARVRQNVLLGVKMVTFVSAPAIILLALLRDPMANLLFDHGNVSADALTMTAGIIAIYSLSLLPLGHFRVLQNYFYAAELRRTAFFQLLIAAASNLALDFALIELWGVYGIAAASVLSLVIVSVGGYALVWPRIGGWPWRDLGAFGGRVLFAGLASAAVVGIVRFMWPVSLDAGAAPSAYILALTVAGGGGGVVYLLASYWLHLKEFRQAIHPHAKRSGRLRPSVAREPLLPASLTGGASERE